MNWTRPARPEDRSKRGAAVARRVELCVAGSKVGSRRVAQRHPAGAAEADPVTRASVAHWTALVPTKS